jgi:hypothetical protein
MQFNWYRLINRQEFIDSELVSVLATVTLIDFGQKEVLVTKGEAVGITIDDVFLPVEMNDKNPYRIGERAVFVDANDDIWLGVFDAG